MSTPEQPHSWQRPTVFYNHTLKYVFYVVSFAVVVWSFLGIAITPDRFITGLAQGQSLLMQMVPPSFEPRERSLIIEGTIETFGMAVVSTILGVAVSFPIAFMSAKNIAPKPVYYLGRTIVMVSRSLHPIVIAIILVTLVGLGPLAGILTLVLTTAGFFSKLLAEDIEEIDVGQMKGVKATGASRYHLYLFAIIPQVLPRIVSLSVYRWDQNLRASTIIGIVGAGGIGMTLQQAVSSYQYQFTLTILLVILALVFAGELISGSIRRSYQ